MTRYLQGLLGLAAVLLSMPASAQSAFPARPIRFIDPFTAGGNTDVVARTSSTPAKARQWVEAEFNRWGRVATAAHISAN